MKSSDPKRRREEPGEGELPKAVASDTQGACSGASLDGPLPSSPRQKLNVGGL